MADQEDDNSILRDEQSPEELAAEEAAFTEAFGKNYESQSVSDGDEGGSIPSNEPAEPNAPAADEPVEPSAPAAEEPAKPAPAAEPAKLIAGLTEEQVASALANAGNLRGTVDKMAGRMGQLMQQLEALKQTPPTTKQAQAAFDLKLEKLSAAFPELAAILKEDLASIGSAPSAPVADAPPPGLSQEDLDKLITERLNSMGAQTREIIETRVLSVIHPDWNDLIREPQFALFRDNVLPAGVGKQLMESEDAAFIAGKLTQYKEWKAAQSKPAAPAPAPVAAPRANRLANAVMPAPARAPAAGPVTEEDAFTAAFNRERGRGGH